MFAYLCRAVNDGAQCDFTPSCGAQKIACGDFLASVFAGKPCGLFQRQGFVIGQYRPPRHSLRGCRRSNLGY